MPDGEREEGLPVPRHAVAPAAIALTLLFLVSVTNYADRTVMSILQELIKHDLTLTDTQLGLLGGPIFAIFYAFVGLPLARLAERSSRKRIIVSAVAVWSLITACCGLARNFPQMALFRVGVGAAESGSPPASHSLVADYFPAHRRGIAMTVLQFGVPVGVAVGSFVAGAVAHHHGWRWAFAAMGMPGLLLALALAIFLREPSRSEASAQGDAVSTWRSVIHLLKGPGFCLLLVAGALGGNASHGLDVFMGSFFIRQHGFSVQQIGGLLAVGRGIAGVTGALLAGLVADHIARRTLRAYSLVAGFAAVCSGLMFCAAFLAADATVSIAAVIAGYFFLNMLPGPSYAAVQNMVGDGVRATAAALYLFFVTVVGSLAAPTVGFVSDLIAARSMPAAMGSYAAACPGGKALVGRAGELGDACQVASAAGLKGALMIPVIILIVTLPVYLLVAQTTPGSAAQARS
jgi:predicted MFS family arabinose efflux permease